MSPLEKQNQDARRIRDFIEALGGNDSVQRTLSFDLALDLMRELGTSVQLNYGEDNNLWELSWISGGKRIVAFSKDKYVAVRGALIKCEEMVKAKMDE